MTKKEYNKYYKEGQLDRYGQQLKVGDIVVATSPYSRLPAIGKIEHFTENGCKVCMGIFRDKWEVPYTYKETSRVIKITSDFLDFWSNRIKIPKDV